MDSKDKQPKTLQEAIKYFSDEQVCIDTVAALRWPPGPFARVRPRSTTTSRLRSGGSAKSAASNSPSRLGTIFEDSPVTLDKWLIALWMLVNWKNGVGSYEVAREIGVTQKSAWFILHRLRLALQDRSGGKIGGPGCKVEMDETFIGGKRGTCTATVHERVASFAVVRMTRAWCSWECLERGGKVRHQGRFQSPQGNASKKRFAIMSPVEFRTVSATDCNRMKA